MNLASEKQREGTQVITIWMKGPAAGLGLTGSISTAEKSWSPLKRRWRARKVNQRTTSEWVDRDGSRRVLFANGRGI